MKATDPSPQITPETSRDESGGKGRMTSSTPGSIRVRRLKYNQLSAAAESWQQVLSSPRRTMPAPTSQPRCSSPSWQVVAPAARPLPRSDRPPDRALRGTARPSLVIADADHEHRVLAPCYRAVYPRARKTRTGRTASVSPPSATSQCRLGSNVITPAAFASRRVEAGVAKTRLVLRGAWASRCCR